MGRIVSVNISLDNSHSLDDFPVDLYSGLTSGDTTNLVFANIVSEDIPFNLQFEDSDINISSDPNNPFTPYLYLRISSDGCYDEIIKLEVPRVDCEICVDFQEIIPEPTPTNVPNPTPTPTQVPNPTPTPTDVPQPTPTSTVGPTPTATDPESTPTPTSTNIPPTPTPADPYNYYFLRTCPPASTDIVVRTTGTLTIGNGEYDSSTVSIFGTCYYAYNVATKLQYDTNAGDAPSQDVSFLTVYGNCSACQGGGPTPTPVPSCNEYSLYMTGQGETSTQWEWTTCGGSTTTWTNTGSNYRVVCSETTPVKNYGDGFSLLNGDCGNYTVSRCDDGALFTVSKHKNCDTGTPPAYSVGDIIQFRQMSVSNGACFGATYCGTITATDSSIPHNALSSRNATVDSCEDELHCSE